MREAASRREAVQIGRALLKRGLLRCVWNTPPVHPGADRYVLRHTGSTERVQLPSAPTQLQGAGSASQTAPLAFAIDSSTRLSNGSAEYNRSDAGTARAADAAGAQGVLIVRAQSGGAQRAVSQQRAISLQHAVMSDEEDDDGAVSDDGASALVAASEGNTEPSPPPPAFMDQPWCFYQLPHSIEYGGAASAASVASDAPCCFLFLHPLTVSVTGHSIAAVEGQLEHQFVVRLCTPSCVARQRH